MGSHLLEKFYARMTDEEARAVQRYLISVEQPRAFT